MFVTARYATLLAMVMVSSGCSLIHVTHCTYWNILPALGINYNPPVCPGGQPTLIITSEDLKRGTTQKNP